MVFLYVGVNFQPDRRSYHFHARLSDTELDRLRPIVDHGDRPRESGSFRERAHPSWLPHRLVQLTYLTFSDRRPSVHCASGSRSDDRPKSAGRIDRRPKSFREPSRIVGYHPTMSASSPTPVELRILPTTPPRPSARIGSPYLFTRLCRLMAAKNI
jgi:hypothetical protein